MTTYMPLVERDEAGYLIRDRDGDYIYLDFADAELVAKQLCGNAGPVDE